MTNRLLIAYGSHTGQAESISKELAERAIAVGLQPDVRKLNDVEKELDLTTESFIVIVVSSTGDGDPPENSARFLRRISNKNLKEDYFKGLTYAILGLGDSNYSTYQGVPIKIDNQLAALGAKRVMERGEADDQVGLELVVEPWTDELFNVVLKERFSLDETLLAAAWGITLDGTKVADEKVTVEGNITVCTLSSCDRATLSLVNFDYPGATVKRGDDEITKNPNLRPPLAPQPYLKGTIGQSIFQSNAELPWQNDAPLLGVASTKPLEAVVASHSILTSLDAPRQQRELVFELTDSDLSYEPGDAFYIIPQNSEAEVNFILERLGCLDTADNEYELSVDPDTAKACAQQLFPAYLPVKSSLRHLFTYCLNIRTYPGRPLLKYLGDAATDEGEKRRLAELCSVQGVLEYHNYVRQASLSLVDVLLAFPSAAPKPERIIETLLRLTPRAYSMTQCKAAGGRRLRFAYSIREEEAESGRRYSRFGVSTGVLIDLEIGQRVQLLAREPSASFRLPPSICLPAAGLYSPLILISQGTGVSAFLSFASHIRSHLRANPDDKECREAKRIMFCSCSDEDKDLIYRNEIDDLQELGIFSTVHLTQSTVEGGPRSVQDSIRSNAAEVFTLLRESASSSYPARIYICGEVSGSSKALLECFVQCAADTGGCSVDEGKEYMKELKKADRYIEQAWY